MNEDEIEQQREADRKAMQKNRKGNIAGGIILICGLIILVGLRDEGWGWAIGSTVIWLGLLSPLYFND